MERFWIQGVVRGGQVVLEKPLDLPEGTVVTVMGYDPADDPRPAGPLIAMTDEDFAELTAFITGKRCKSEWPEFEARLVAKYGEPWKQHPLYAPEPNYDPGPEAPKLVMTDEEFAEFTEYFTGKKDRKDFAAFVERVERAQGGRTLPRGAA